MNKEIIAYALFFKNFYCNELIDWLMFPTLPLNALYWKWRNEITRVPLIAVPYPSFILTCHANHAIPFLSFPIIPYHPIHPTIPILPTQPTQNPQAENHHHEKGLVDSIKVQLVNNQVS